MKVLIAMDSSPASQRVLEEVAAGPAHRLKTDLRKPLFRSVTRTDGGVVRLSGSRSKLLSPLL